MIMNGFRVPSSSVSWFPFPTTAHVESFLYKEPLRMRGEVLKERLIPHLFPRIDLLPFRK
jgi:hypothetical protein